jgi:hypothetical protein
MANDHHTEVDDMQFTKHKNFVQIPLPIFIFISILQSCMIKVQISLQSDDFTSGQLSTKTNSKTKTNIDIKALSVIFSISKRPPNSAHVSNRSHNMSFSFSEFCVTNTDEPKLLSALINYRWNCHKRLTDLSSDMWMKMAILGTVRDF